MSFRLLYPLLRKNNYLTARISRVSLRTLKTIEEKEVKEVNNEPIQYSTSKAGQWQAKYSTSGKDYFKYPPSQSKFVVLSLTAFMVYFCILREENDLDDWLRDIERNMPLKLEESQLQEQIKQGKKAKMDVSTYETRLKNIHAIQEKAGFSPQSR